MPSSQPRTNTEASFSERSNSPGQPPTTTRSRSGPTEPARQRRGASPSWANHSLGRCSTYKRLVKISLPRTVRLARLLSFLAPASLTSDVLRYYVLWL